LDVCSEKLKVKLIALLNIFSLRTLCDLRALAVNQKQIQKQPWGYYSTLMQNKKSKVGKVGRWEMEDGSLQLAVARGMKLKIED